MRRWIVSFSLLAFVSSPLACSQEPRDTTSPEQGAVDPLQELVGIPAAIDAEVQLVLAPIHEVDRVLDQVATMSERLGLEPSSLRALALASLQDGEVAVALDVPDAARAEVEALLDSVRRIGEQLRETPTRVASASKTIVGQGAKAAVLAGKLSARLQAKLALPFVSEEEKGRLREQLATVTRIEGEVRTMVAEAKSTVVDLPARTTAAMAKLTAGLAGMG